MLSVCYTQNNNHPLAPDGGNYRGTCYPLTVMVGGEGMILSVEVCDVPCLGSVVAAGRDRSLHLVVPVLGDEDAAG